MVQQDPRRSSCRAKVTFLASQGLQVLVDVTQAAEQRREPLWLVSQRYPCGICRPTLATSCPHTSRRTQIFDRALKVGCDVCRVVFEGFLWRDC